MCTTCGCGPIRPVKGKRRQAIDTTLIELGTAVLAENAQIATALRRRFKRSQTLALNLVSSPGSGKTTLLVETLKQLQAELPILVLEGDQQTALDADRIAATGVAVHQINTGQGCHLDARMITQALERFAVPRRGLLLIENVGNLVCPAAFDLGEAAKVAVLSVTEGEDKPLKYPDMFRAASLMLLNKCDLLPHLQYRTELAINYAKQVNPDIEVIQISALSGEGMPQWLEWIQQQHTHLKKTTRVSYRTAGAQA